MTRYAIDEQRKALVASWSVGNADVAITAATLPQHVAQERNLALAGTLTALSRELWRCYTHPATAADSLDVNTEGWQRQQTRESFALVVDALKKPNLPTDAGTLMVSYDPVEECAHRVGRVAHAIGDSTLLEQIVADVTAELAAVEQAELGDLSGRAQQAVSLTRQSASPVQVAAASQVLHDSLLHGDALFERFDPTAAAVAAAHWLQAAADVVEEVSGVPATAVVERADDIEAIPHVTPTRVLELMELGMPPYAVVTELISGAMLVAEGEVPDPIDLRDNITDAEEQADKYGNDEILKELRLTPLDPQRPALDLLEDLLLGIHGCWLLYYNETDIELDDDDDESDDRYEQAQDAFVAAVRRRANEDRDRLL